MPCSMHYIQSEKSQLRLYRTRTVIDLVPSKPPPRHVLLQTICSLSVYVLSRRVKSLKLATFPRLPKKFGGQNCIPNPTRRNFDPTPFLSFVVVCLWPPVPPKKCTMVLWNPMGTGKSPCFSKWNAGNLSNFKASSFGRFQSFIPPGGCTYLAVGMITLFTDPILPWAKGGEPKNAPKEGGISFQSKIEWDPTNGLSKLRSS